MKSVSSVLVRVSPIQSRINVSLANAVILCSTGRDSRATGEERTALGAGRRKQLRRSRALIVFKYNAIKMKVQIMLHQHQRQQYNQPTAGTRQQERAWRVWRLSMMPGQMAGSWRGRHGVKGCCVAGSADNSMSCSICLHANAPRREAGPLEWVAAGCLGVQAAA